MTEKRKREDKVTTNDGDTEDNEKAFADAASDSDNVVADQNDTGDNDNVVDDSGDNDNNTDDDSGDNDKNDDSDDDEGDKNDSDNVIVDNEEIQVDFEFMVPSEIDYHGLKALLKQSFASELDSLNDIEMIENIIKDDKFTVVKVDGQLDPFAVLGLVEIDEKLKNFLIDKSSGIKDYLENAVFVFNERLINMPPQIFPPMFEMMVDQEYCFNYFIFISKCYKLKAQPNKKKKKKMEMFYYQVEDEFIEPFSIYSFDYTNDQQPSDSRRVFQDEGILSFRRVFVLEKDSLIKLKRIFKDKI